MANRGVVIAVGIAGVSVCLLIFAGGFLSGASYVLKRNPENSTAAVSAKTRPATLASANGKDVAPGVASKDLSPGTSANPAAGAVAAKEAPGKAAGSGVAESRSGKIRPLAEPPTGKSKGASTAPATGAGGTAAAGGSAAPPVPAESADDIRVRSGHPSLLIPASPTNKTTLATLGAGDPSTPGVTAPDEPSSRKPAATEKTAKELIVPMPALVNPLLDPPKPMPAAARGGAPFSLQVGAFLDAQFAKKAAANLKARSYDAYILKTVDSQNRTWLRVRFGAYTTEQKARASALAFERKVGIPALVVRKPKPPVPVAKQ